MAKTSVPFVAALSHLRMEFDKGSAPAFEAIAFQGDRAIPAASSKAVSSFLDGAVPAASLPQGFELKMLDMLFEDSPTGTKLAWHGMVQFGAGKKVEAARCAHEVLGKNRSSLLARQLLSLVLAKTDVRKPFGGAVSEAPDVVEIVRREVDTD